MSQEDTKRVSTQYYICLIFKNERMLHAIIRSDPQTIMCIKDVGLFENNCASSKLLCMHKIIRGVRMGDCAISFLFPLNGNKYFIL